jgi:16S rRNA (guanine527-N7)-methyltransferase
MTNHFDADGRGTGTAGPAPVPPSAAAVFGDRLPLAETYAALLADTGVTHGLIGPREVPILWERHILNCAVAHEAFPVGAELVDVGSGAGLPGVALAIVRPDLTVHLVEPMLRRTAWLESTIGQVGLTNCLVHRGRAEEFHDVLALPWATARAVARIDKLARWTFPLLSPEGTLVALKGAQAAEELAAEEGVLRRLGMVSSAVRTYGAAVLDVPTVTLELTVGPRGPAGSGGSQRASKAGQRGGSLAGRRPRRRAKGRPAGGRDTSADGP